MARRICLTAAGVFFLALVSSSAAPNSDSDPTAEQIKRRIQDADAAVEQLIKQLDDNNFEKRERATRELIEVGVPALPVLRAALKEPDSLEARERIEKIIARLTPKPKWPDLLTQKVRIAPEKAKLFEDPKTTVKDALDWLASEYNFSYKVNEKRLEIASGGTKAEEYLSVSLLRQGPFPIGNETSLLELLQKIVSCMPGEDQNATALMVR